MAHAHGQQVVKRDEVLALVTQRDSEWKRALLHTKGEARKNVVGVRDGDGGQIVSTAIAAAESKRVGLLAVAAHLDLVFGLALSVFGVVCETVGRLSRGFPGSQLRGRVDVRKGDRNLHLSKVTELCRTKERVLACVGGVQVSICIYDSIAHLERGVAVARRNDDKDRTREKCTSVHKLRALRCDIYTLCVCVCACEHT